MVGYWSYFKPNFYHVLEIKFISVLNHSHHGFSEHIIHQIKTSIRQDINL